MVRVVGDRAFGTVGRASKSCQMTYQMHPLIDLRDRKRSRGDK